MASIADQHVVVLGGTSGFGFATAKAAITEGARVTIASRSSEKLRGALVRLGNSASDDRGWRPFIPSRSVAQDFSPVAPS
jgi:NAD(P)-dependent dehydrogenase (short-subunit alcohol dehydrogenase family)